MSKALENLENDHSDFDKKSLLDNPPSDPMDLFHTWFEDANDSDDIEVNKNVIKFAKLFIECDESEAKYRGLNNEPLKKIYKWKRDNSLGHGVHHSWASCSKSPQTFLAQCLHSPNDWTNDCRQTPTTALHNVQ